MIKMTEFAKRRKAIMQIVGANGVMILPAAKEVYRNHDALFPFRQHSDFYYMTGYEEPESVMVLLPKRKEGEYVLFNRVRDPSREAWDGPRSGQAGARKEFLADQAFPIGELEARLPDLLAGRDTVHYAFGHDKAFDEMVMAAMHKVREKVRTGIKTPTQLIDVTASIHEMRLCKSPAEIAVMQKAIDITHKAHVRAMEMCRPGMKEYQLEAEMMHEFYNNGARSPAYTSIVAAGKNACVLHYVTNRDIIRDGDLVLIDAGCEYENYASDITRTFPANGKFTGEQRAIYELVLVAQLAAIKAIKPGAPCMIGQDVAVKVLTQGLIDLGLLKGRLDDLIEKQAYFAFYFHRIGHWLGLDVHDMGRYKVQGDKWRPLEAGHTLTVEPGIYISPSIPGVHKRWHNIGVRIEDDVLVTKKGNEVLSHRIPKKVADIEAIMAK
jgi:Xaa-Pro aminopeptidase